MKGGAVEPESPYAGGFAILNCPAHAPFFQTLAASVLDGSIWNASAPEPHDLPALTIYVPAQAAIEPLKLAFLWLSPNGATFLPRIRVLGEPDPLDLFAAFGTRMRSADEALSLLEKALAVPPAFDDLERQIYLSAYVLKAADEIQSTSAASGERLYADVTAASAAAMAAEISALVDEAYSVGADFSRIGMLDAAQSSGSEQLSLQLLRAVWKCWQERKARAGKLGREERRTRLMAIEAEFIRQSEAPVIIAGSTGSVAATMALMEALKGRASSAIVLYGLDRNLDTESWAAAVESPEHPQHGLHQLLARLDVKRENIRDLSELRLIHLGRTPSPQPSPHGRGSLAGTAAQGKGLLVGHIDESRAGGPPAADARLRRTRFLSEALRPASTAAQWPLFVRELKDEKGVGGGSLSGLSLIEAETIQEEAAAIALILREALETEGQTAALVTPDEKLIARVRHGLAQWGLDERQTAERDGDAFAARAASCAATGKPADFVTLIAQAQGQRATVLRRFAEVIDLGVLRQMWRPSSVQGIEAALARAQHAIASGEARHPAMKRIAPFEWEAARDFAASLLGALSPLTSLAEERLDLNTWMGEHAEVLARLAELGFENACSKDDERSTLQEAASVTTPSLTLDIAGYAGFFGAISASRHRNQQENPHPRLFLWKPLDARLHTADVIVLGGLNEGCWPRSPGPSPWLNRRDRAFVGLPPEERRIGLAAHDFAALTASAPRVICTRARRIDGSLTRPSRWVARIKALAVGAGKLQAIEPGKPWTLWARMHRAPANVTPVQRPAPCPPISARPRRLSVTAIETWLANPYAIYARHILGLEPLRRIGETHDAREKGILYHAALHRFFQAHPQALPTNSAAELVKCLDRAAEELGFNLENAPFWRPRFARFAEWFASVDENWRGQLGTLKSEVGGKLKLEAPAGPFEVTARADRIDLFRDGAVRIYDFKTSANTAKVSAARGAPQLSLEGLLAREGAFAGIPEGAAADLHYIVATGGEPPGEIVPLKKPSAEAIDEAQAGLLARITMFDDPATAYAYEARAIYRDKVEHDPYAHLARVAEWSHGAEADDEADDE